VDTDPFGAAAGVGDTLPHVADITEADLLRLALAVVGAKDWGQAALSLAPEPGLTVIARRTLEAGWIAARDRNNGQGAEDPSRAHGAFSRPSS
jgi:hypothetical protein